MPWRQPPARGSCSFCCSSSAPPDWPTARGLAIQIDRESRDELPVVPLWQLVDHYAWRDRLKGPAAVSSDLYRGIETWREVHRGSPTILGTSLDSVHARAGLGMCRPLWIGPGGSARSLGQQPSPATPTTTAPNAEKLPIKRRRTRSWSTWCVYPSARIDVAPVRARAWFGNGKFWYIGSLAHLGWYRSHPTRAPLSNLDVDAHKPDAFASVGPFDKVWLIGIAHAEAGSGLVFKGREYDSDHARLGTLRRRSVPVAG